MKTQPLQLRSFSGEAGRWGKGCRGGQQAPLPQQGWPKVPAGAAGLTSQSILPLFGTTGKSQKLASKPGTYLLLSAGDKSKVECTLGAGPAGAAPAVRGISFTLGKASASAALQQDKKSGRWALKGEGAGWE